MIGAGQAGIERELVRAVGPFMQSDDNVHAAARDFFVNGLANSGLERGEIARKVDNDVALLPVHGVQLDAEFRAR
jgi:hypothetical protein